jgi:2-polyprenyl-3-methyl-5-hydroxy-6-metoxy-1,4-benzoquinol methylase
MTRQRAEYDPENHLRAPDDPNNHARLNLNADVPPTLDTVLHVSRYEWAINLWVRPDDEAIDLGCGTGYGTQRVALKCRSAVGVDFDPSVTELTKRYGLSNLAFRCENICSQSLIQAFGQQRFDVAISMETIEHLEDYFTYLDNIVELLKPDGRLVLGTPNRAMTYERYPDRRHMDKSHIQEFTPLSLSRVLAQYFENVELYYQVVPNYWDGKANPNLKNTENGIYQRLMRSLMPPIFGLVSKRASKRVKARISRKSDRTLYPVFMKAGDHPEYFDEGFGLMAVARNPIMNEIL